MAVSTSLKGIGDDWVVDDVASPWGLILRWNRIGCVLAHRGQIRQL